MPDCHQSTRSTPATPTAPPRAGAPAIREQDPQPHPPSLALRPRFSIRLADRGGAECSICGELTGSGPIGCSDDEPICDRCLIEGCHELGMVLALVAITRGVARLEPPTEQQAREALDELGNFAKVYEHIAARLGPPRPFRIPGTDEPTH